MIISDGNINDESTGYEIIKIIIIVIIIIIVKMVMIMTIIKV